LSSGLRAVRVAPWRAVLSGWTLYSSISSLECTAMRPSTHVKSVTVGFRELREFVTPAIPGRARSGSERGRPRFGDPRSLPRGAHSIRLGVSLSPSRVVLELARTTTERTGRECGLAGPGISVRRNV
jgi:hypothetical protein